MLVGNVRFGSKPAILKLNTFQIFASPVISDRDTPFKHTHTTA